MNDFQKFSIVAALKKMFKDNCFSICTVDKCLRVANTIPDADVYNALSALHCVSWSEMPQDKREEVFKLTLSLFKEGTGFDLDAIDTVFGTKSDFVEITSEDFESKKTRKRSRIMALIGGGSNEKI